MRRFLRVPGGAAWLVAAGLLGVVWAQQQDVFVSYRDFSGGFVDWIPATNLEPNQSPNAQNLIIDPVGSGAKKRKGVKACGSLPSGLAAVGAFKFWASPGDERLVVTDSVNWYETADCTVFKTITTDNTDNTMPDCEMVYGNLWCLNGINAAWYWNGTSTQTLNGNNSTPTVPIGAHIEFCGGRVWITRTGSARSSAFFSALSNTAGEDIVPSSSTAWPAANEIFFGKDDGDQIEGLKCYRNVPHVFKQRSIWRVSGEDEFSFGSEKILDGFGTKSNHSIVETDGLLNSLDANSIYVFDGQNADPVLDVRSPLFNSIQKPATTNDGKTWTTQGDWNAGTFSNTSSSKTVGSVILSSTTETEDDFSDGNFTSNPVWTVQGGGTWQVSGGRLTVSGALGFDYISTPSTQAYGSWEFDLAAPGGNTSGCFSFISQGTDDRQCAANVGSSAYLIYRQRADVVQLKLNQTVLCQFSGVPGVQSFRIERNADNVFKVFSGGNQVCSVSDGSLTTSSNMMLAYSATSWDGLDNLKVWHYAASGTYTTEAFDHSTALTAHGTFIVEDALNGETLTYQVRTGTSSDMNAATAYRSISNGQSISTTTHRFSQYRANLSRATNDTASTPELKLINVTWLEGGNPVLIPWAGNWEGRYVVFTATGSSTQKLTAIVKSRSPLKSVMPWRDMDVAAFERVGDAYYGVSSSSAQISTIFDGYRDLSAAIDAFWETKDTDFGLPFNYKWVHWIYSQYDRTGSGNLTVSASTSSGAGWTDYTEFQTGSGLTSERAGVDIGPATSWRFRVRQNSIDDQMHVFGFMPSGVALKADVP